MWLHQFTNWTLQRRWQTIVTVFSCTMMSTIVGKYLSELPLLLSLFGMLAAILLGTAAVTIATFVTLVKGMLDGAVLTFFATIPYFISIYLPNGTTDTPALSIWVGVGVAVISNLLTWVFAVMLHRQASWSLVLQIAALVGVLVVSVIHLAFPGVVDWWGNQLQSMHLFYEQAAAVTADTASNAAAQTTEMVNVAKQFVNGVLVAAILCNAAVQLIIARWWQCAVFMPGTLRKELRGIRLTQLAGVLFVMSLVFSYRENSVVLDIMPILYVLFGAAGLSLIHYLFGLVQSPTVWFWLTLIYVTLLIGMPYTLVVVTMLALLDIWLDIRKRFRKIY